MTTDPIATPIEKTPRTRLATLAPAVSTFFTSGGKMTTSTEPIVQKKLIAQIARNSRGMWSVPEISRHEAVNGLRSSFSGGPSRGAGGT